MDDKRSRQLREQRQLTRKVREVEREVGELTVRHWTKAEIKRQWPNGYDTSTLPDDASVFPRLPKIRVWRD